MQVLEKWYGVMSLEVLVRPKTLGFCVFLFFFIQLWWHHSHFHILECHSFSAWEVGMCICEWVVVVQSLSHVWLCSPMNCNTPGFPVLYHLPEFAQTLVHRVGDAIQPSHPLSPLLLLPSIFPSISIFSNESALGIRWPKYSASASVLPVNIQVWFPLRLIEWVSVCIKTIQEKNNQVLHSLENNWLIN